ncbi:interferon alpha-F-like [Scyliorhinus canicula]|uniref:interferon alpha-F-like n=1 Tax=Scyliorhinus canicula TaxID=7830 RepID=UPI0018F51468|nr:interferon alpha-F-like [Scyliorhinus canicula]
MALASIWRFGTVLLLLSATLSLGCERLQLQQVLNTETLSKLNEMAGRFPRQCVRERFALTTKTLNLVKLSEGLQTQDRIQIVHQTLRHISKIYSMNWVQSPGTGTRWKTLRLLLDRQLSELEECARKQGSEARLRKNSTIQKYFRKLRKFLKQKTFSNCAWEIIRAETRARLQQLLYLMAQVRRRN